MERKQAEDAAWSRRGQERNYHRLGLNKFIEKFEVVSSTDDVHATRKRFVMHVV